MQAVQGFVTIQQYIQNPPGQISPIGELTTLSRTFTKEIGQYASSVTPGYLFHSFSVKDVATNAEQVVSDDLAALILDVARAINAYAINHSRPYDTEDFLMNVAAQFAFKITGLTFGALVYGHNIELPEWVTFNTETNGGAAVKFWFADNSFRDQYTDYSITVTAPLEDLNAFFDNYAMVLPKLEAVTTPDLIDRVQASKDSNPDSVVKVLEFFFHNAYSTQIKHKTPFGFLIYGNEGNYTDNILDYLVEWLVNNSNHTAAEWEMIFPDIFKRTEFLLVPRWDLLATFNATENASQYSQVANIFNVADYAEKYLAFYASQSYIRNNSYLVTFPWRTLMATITNGVKNAPGKTDWQTMFPDYIPIPTAGNPSFGQMKPDTQEWSRFIQDVLLQAETATPATFLPKGYRRVMRDNRLFVSGTHKNVNYLVAAKWNLTN